MQDIPRNQLLDNIAQGWTVRRKDWVEGKVFCLHPYKPKGSTVIFLDWAELVHQDDWEGEPPEVKCLSGKLHMVAAFALLQEGTVKFIRRPSWDKCKLFKHSVMCFALNYEDIQTSDWEVWA